LGDPTIIVRPGGIDDLAAEATLHKDAGWCYDEHDALLHYHDDDYEPGWSIIAEVDGHVVGKIELFVGWKSNHGRFGMIRRFVVAEEWRSAGIGRALVEAAHAQARELGCAFVELVVDVNNPVAHAYYQRLGYGEDRVEVVMRLSLDGQPHASRFLMGYAPE
jgi:GNAT superfamily N-acetyltransferase